MARTKNVEGGLGDDDRRPLPCLPTDPKGKATKKIASKKRKYPDAEIARAAAVAETAERAERGGAHSGVMIADQQLTPAQRTTVEEAERFHGSPLGTMTMAGRRLPVVDPQPQGESQQES